MAVEGAMWNVFRMNNTALETALAASVGTICLEARIAQAVATVIAIVLGGITAWRQCFIFRLEQPHVTISHDITHRLIGHGYAHIEVDIAYYGYLMVGGWASYEEQYF